MALSPLFASEAVRHAPEQAGFVEFLLALELIVGDEVDLPAEPGDHRSFLVTMTDPFLLVGKLAGIETAVRPVNTAKIPYLRLPHRVGRRIECAEFVGLPVLESPESANGAVHDVAGQFGHPFHPRYIIGSIEGAEVSLRNLEIRPIATGLDILPFVASKRIRRPATHRLVKPSGAVVVGPVRP